MNDKLHDPIPIRRGILTDPNDNTRLNEFDTLYPVPVGMTLLHHKIHDGDAYDMYMNSNGLDTSEFIEIGLITPAVTDPQKRIHLSYSARLNDDGTFIILEDVSDLAVGAGAAQTPLNRFRGSSNTSDVTVPVTGESGAAITYSGGDTIWNETWEGSISSIVTLSGRDERILEPATSYVFRLTSNAVGAGRGGHLSLHWYEMTDK